MASPPCSTTDWTPLVSPGLLMYTAHQSVSLRYVLPQPCLRPAQQQSSHAAATGALSCLPHDLRSFPWECARCGLRERPEPGSHLESLCISPLGLTRVHCCHRPCDAARAKYALKHSVRTHLGADDQGYTAMGFGADAEGVQGMYMRKHVIEMAQRGLVENLRRLQPLMTPTAVKVRCQACLWSHVSADFQ